MILLWSCRGEGEWFHEGDSSQIAANGFQANAAAACGSHWRRNGCRLRPVQNSRLAQTLVVRTKAADREGGKLPGIPERAAMDAWRRGNGCQPSALLLQRARCLESTGRP